MPREITKYIFSVLLVLDRSIVQYNTKCNIHQNNTPIKESHPCEYCSLGAPHRFVVSICSDKQRVLMHGHQGWNVRQGLCHIYMKYVYIYIYELFIAFVSFVLFVHYCNLIVCMVYWVGKWQSRGSTGMFGNLMAIYHSMLQFIQNHSRFVMLMIWK